MMNYGMVVLSTHGSGGGKALLTGEIADTLLPEYQTYKALMKGDDPKMGISKNMTISKQGTGTMKYPSEIVNGNFEKGMLGWAKSGDGRVISQLGSEDTGEGLYIGIISTGLGYTTATGSIFQSFTVPNNAHTLELKWNFLSEEFLEYIGSSYQDKFSIVLESDVFGEEILLSRTIDGIAAEFGASAPTTDNPEGIPGDLIAVSPDIVFDQGGVYKTGWQSESFDIKSYRGKCVTLIFRSTDVGDSIYDTAILIDDVKIK